MNSRPDYYEGGRYETNAQQSFGFDTPRSGMVKHRGYMGGRGDDPHGVTRPDGDERPPGGSRVPARPKSPQGSGGAYVTAGV